ncbi:MAG TPA: DoxX family protein [Chryseosolibacter sp.]
MTAKQDKNSKGWNISLWVAQILLAIMFLQVGFMKTFVPIAELSKMVPLAAEMPGLIRFIGVSELAGGLGLLLPSALRIWPKGSVWAALALGFVMVLAAGFHASKNESVIINLVLLAVAAFIAWGRTYIAPIQPRATHQSVVNN